ncbi:hypothetical protein L0F63_006004 [Massospora cicadina]|nr:hypothetical protein L0F63_006004 [Massospora cicadina]
MWRSDEACFGQPPSRATEHVRRPEASFQNDVSNQLHDVFSYGNPNVTLASSGHWAAHPNPRTLMDGVQYEGFKYFDTRSHPNFYTDPNLSRNRPLLHKEGLMYPVSHFERSLDPSLRPDLYDRRGYPLRDVQHAPMGTYDPLKPPERFSGPPHDVRFGNPSKGFGTRPAAYLPAAYNHRPNLGRPVVREREYSPRSSFTNSERAYAAPRARYLGRNASSDGFGAPNRKAFRYRERSPSLSARRNPGACSRHKSPKPDRAGAYRQDLDGPDVASRPQAAPKAGEAVVEATPAHKVGRPAASCIVSTKPPNLNYNADKCASVTTNTESRENASASKAKAGENVRLKPTKKLLRNEHDDQLHPRVARGSPQSPADIAASLSERQRVWDGGFLHATRTILGELPHDVRQRVLLVIRNKFPRFFLPDGELCLQTRWSSTPEGSEASPQLNPVEPNPPLILQESEDVIWSEVDNEPTWKPTPQDTTPEAVTPHPDAELPPAACPPPLAPSKPAGGAYAPKALPNGFSIHDINTLFVAMLSSEPIAQVTVPKCHYLLQKRAVHLGRDAWLNLFKTPASRFPGTSLVLQAILHTPLDKNLDYRAINKLASRGELRWDRISTLPEVYRPGRELNPPHLRGPHNPNFGPSAPRRPPECPHTRPRKPALRTPPRHR